MPVALGEDQQIVEVDERVEVGITLSVGACLRDEHGVALPIGRLTADAVGIDVDEYVRLYDTDVVEPYPGATELIDGLDRWAVCSNKHPESGTAELVRLGWTPEVALFSDAFGGAAKQLAPVLDLVGVEAGRTLFVGDTAHDARCAEVVGCDFAWAAWNPRTAATSPPGTVLTDPRQVLDLL